MNKNHLSWFQVPGENFVLCTNVWFPMGIRQRNVPESVCIWWSSTGDQKAEKGVTRGYKMHLINSTALDHVSQLLLAQQRNTYVHKRKQLVLIECGQRIGQNPVHSVANQNCAYPWLGNFSDNVKEKNIFLKILSAKWGNLEFWSCLMLQKAA